LTFSLFSFSLSFSSCSGMRTSCTFSWPSVYWSRSCVTGPL
jgi:hypothetical protein